MTGSKGSGSKRDNLFAKLAVQNANAARHEEAAAEPAAEAVSPSPALPEPVTKKPAPARKRSATVKGKRVHPDYCQANAYIPKKLRLAVERELLELKPLDYSSLVEELLGKWLKSRGVFE